MVDIKSRELKLVNISEIKPNPENNNEHTPEQLEQIMLIIKHQGFRTPLTVSNQSGLLVCGHLRLQAAKALGMQQVPVMYQDFANADDEYLHLTADNAIQRQSVINMAAVNLKMAELGPIDINLLGIAGLVVDPIELPDLPDGDKSELGQITFTLSKEQVETVNTAIKECLAHADVSNELNENKNGNAIAHICELYLGKHGNG